MAEDRSIDLRDYLIIILKWKKLLIAIFIFSLILSYLAVYFLIDAEYDSTALIIPSEDNSLTGISGLMKNIKNLPLGLGGNSNSASTDLYLTLLYSRSNLENIINKFGLKKDYNLESMEEALKVVSKKIEAEVTDENAFRIKVRANDRKKAKAIADYNLDYLNNKVIELNISKSKENRIFLENRYNELKVNLKNAEDSLQFFQQKSGMYEAKEQMKVIASAYSELETRLMTKQTELDVLQSLYEKGSPQIKILENEVKNYEEKLFELKKEGRPESFFLAYNSLPKKVKQYLRYYRDVEIYNSILEFIVPLYEQAKFEEQKNIPVFQVIDYGSFPEKKAYPPRTLFAGLSALIIFIITVIYLIVSSITFDNKSNKFSLKEKKLS